MLRELADEEVIDSAGPVGPQVYLLSRITEAEVAQSLGGSRRPVREAFIRLFEVHEETFVSDAREFVPIDGRFHARSPKRRASPLSGTSSGA